MPEKTHRRRHPHRRGFVTYILVFELDWRPVSQRGMQPHLIVDLFDELRHVVVQLFQTTKGTSIEFFLLQRLDEALALAVFPGTPGLLMLRTAPQDSSR